MLRLLLPRLFATLFLLMPLFAVQADEVISEHIDIHQFANLIAENSDNPDIEIIDVRTPEEFHAGHIENAVVIDFYGKDFVNKLEQLDKNKTYLLYCRSGNRSGQTLKLMRNLGFKATYNMKGGMKKWVPANLPVVKP
jgi:rhodanese-related sulfurtransferase